MIILILVYRTQIYIYINNIITCIIHIYKLSMHIIYTIYTLYTIYDLIFLI